MSAFRLHLWREWREHRLALVSLGLGLPFATWLLTLPLSRGMVNDPLFHAAAALAFAVVLLIAVGGELLGAERRTNGLRWLERLPTGLGAAFRAKLAFFLVTTIAATTLGYGSGWFVGVLRPRAIVTTRFDPSLFLLMLVAVVWGLWTFAASAWALRGGVAFLAAAMVLGVVGFPIWRVIDAGYRPSAGELAFLIALLVPAALLGAWLAFGRAARLGRSTMRSTLYGLAPALPVLLATGGWSSARLAERDAFDPLATDFGLVGQFITSDGHYAIGFGQHFRQERWDLERMPEFALRIDLETGEVEELGRRVSDDMVYRADEHGLPRPDAIVVAVEGAQTPRVFDATDGTARTFDPRASGLHWFSRGLGHQVQTSPHQPAVIRDPFRARDYTASEVVLRNGRVLVRPGRWLRSTNSDWHWFDPDTRQDEPVDWAPGVEPLVLLEDGRILLSDHEHGMRVLDPEHGLSRPLETHGIEHIEPNWNGLRTPGSSRQSPETGTKGSILLRTRNDGWLVVDPELTQVRRLDIPRYVDIRQRIGPDTFIVKSTTTGALERLDVARGTLTRLWPRGGGFQ